MLPCDKVDVWVITGYLCPIAGLLCAGTNLAARRKWSLPLGVLNVLPQTVSWQWPKMDFPLRDVRAHLPQHIQSWWKSLA